MIQSLLNFLSNNPVMSTEQIADAIGATPKTTMGMLNVYEQQGCITRMSTPDSSSGNEQTEFWLYIDPASRAEW